MSDDRLQATTPMQPQPGPGDLGAVVRVRGVPAQPDSFRLANGPCRIGTAPTCDIVVSEPTVSRVHVALSLVPEGVAVEDLKSLNGTFYLDQRIERMVLGLGGRIRIGAATVAIEADTAVELDYDGDGYRGIVGSSGEMRRVFALLARLERSLASVLVEGESGVGKEVVARALHEGSSVAAGPLVAIDCGSLPRELIASELFGHRRGAFTGATDSRKGAFETASGGTLFLDEVGELPLDLQPVLLRALETGEVRPIGEDAPRKVKVRVVAATNRDLEVEAREGRFREDLFYRLAVVRLRVPPLRVRVEDVAPLAAHFAREAGLDALPPGIVEQLKQRQWPGNARELRNAVHAYAALGVLSEPTRSKAATLDLALREMIDPKVGYSDHKERLVERFTTVYLQVLLERAGGNQTVAARMAGLDRGYLGRLLAKHGLVKGS